MHPGAIAAVTPDKPAIVMGGSGRVITYRELDEESNRLAHVFRSAGLKPGDHVAFMLENHPLFLVVAWAAHRSGLYYTAISSRLQTDELAYIVDNCGARVFIGSARLADVASSVAEATPKVELRLMLDGVLWRLNTGTGWRDLPERFGPWQTVYDRFNTMRKSGLLDRIVERLQLHLNEKGFIDPELFCIDGTNVRAAKAAAGAAEKKSPAR